MRRLASCGSRCSGGLQATSTSTTPSACAMIRHWAGLSAAKRDQIKRPYQARWRGFETRWLVAERNLSELRSPAARPCQVHRTAQV